MNNVNFNELSVENVRDLLIAFIEFLQPYWEQFLWNLDLLLNRMAGFIKIIAFFGNYNMVQALDYLIYL